MGRHEHSVIIIVCPRDTCSREYKNSTAGIEEKIIMKMSMMIDNDNNGV